MNIGTVIAIVVVRAAGRPGTHRMENVMDHDTYNNIFCTMFARRCRIRVDRDWSMQRYYEVQELLATMAGMIIVIED